MINKTTQNEQKPAYSACKECTSGIHLNESGFEAETHLCAQCKCGVADAVKFLGMLIVCCAFASVTTNIVTQYMQKPIIKVVHYVCIKYEDGSDMHCRDANDEELLNNATEKRNLVK